MITYELKRKMSCPLYKDEADSYSLRYVAKKWW